MAQRMCARPTAESSGAQRAAPIMVARLKPKQPPTASPGQLLDAQDSPTHDRMGRRGCGGGSGRLRHPRSSGGTRDWKAGLRPSTPEQGMGGARDRQAEPRPNPNPATDRPGPREGRPGPPAGSGSWRTCGRRILGRLRGLAVVASSAGLLRSATGEETTARGSARAMRSRPCGCDRQRENKRSRRPLPMCCDQQRKAGGRTVLHPRPTER